ncbi:DUF998 domain-containing protein [Thermococcus sp. 2319x1]|uniref:DUF998 domain-containing protein n=1 Tax=Thermococcus sp. 2319x1 TaxID=1674923 RepID=UPI001EF015FB|nr:DUF998 domain-containing protein [Thermococcus sp. 2319x1]
MVLVFEHALSDLGTGEANSPWIYNYGLIVSSIFVMLFAVYLVLISQTKLQTVGGAYISVAAIFRALIGLYPGGTRPHVFVSTYFFVQFFLGMFLYGSGSEKMVRTISTLLFILAVIGTLIEWPSVALIETYEIVLILVFTLLIASQ